MVNINGEVADTIMGQTVPTDSTPGPLYAEDIAANLLYHVAPHTHTGVGNLDGYQLGADSLDITSDINFNTTNLNSLRSARFSSQSSALVGSQDLNSLYVVDGNLFYNNEDGYAVQITTNNTIVDVSNFLTTLTPVSINSPSVPFIIPSSATYNLLEISSSTNAVTITLPIAATVGNGRFYFFQDVGGVAETNNVTIQVAGGSGNLIYQSSNAGTTSVLLADQNFGGYIYSNGSNNWHIQLFSTLTYNTETMTFQGSSNLVVDTTLTFGDFASVVGDITLTSGYDLVVPSGAQIVLQSGSNLHADGTIALSTSSELDGYGLTQFQPGSNTTFLSGSTLTINNGCPVVINGTVANNNIFTSTGAIVAESAVEISGQLAVNGGITSLGAPIFWSNPSVVNIAGGSGTHSTTFTSGQYNSPIIRVTRTNPITGTWTFIFPTYPTVPDGTTWMLDLNACMTPGTDTGSIEIVVGSLPNVLVYNNTSAPVYYYKNMFTVQVNKDAITTVCG